MKVAEKLGPRFRRERDIKKRAEIAQGLLDIEVAATAALAGRLGFTALMKMLIGKVG